VSGLDALIDRYWELAYAEGKEGRDHDTEDGAAQQCRMEIDAGLAELRRDAERYRWLRDNCFQTENMSRAHPYAMVQVHLDDSRYMLPGHNPGVGVPSLDAAIDAASQQAKPPGD